MYKHLQSTRLAKTLLAAALILLSPSISAQNNEPYFDEELGFYLVEQNGRYGLMDKEGKMVLPTEYDAFNLFSADGDIHVYKDDKEGIYAPGIGFIVPCKYDDIFFNDAGHMWVCDNDLYGVYDFRGNEIIPVAHDIDHIFLVENNYYKTTTGGQTHYYELNGQEIPIKREIIVTSQDMVHNNYDKNNAKGLKLIYNFDTRFLTDEPIYVELLVYNQNGTPAKKKNGEQIKWGGTYTPGYLFTTFTGQWFTIPYNNFVQPAGTKRDYYAKLRFKDQKGNVLPTTGNNKVTFYLSR